MTPMSTVPADAGSVVGAWVVLIVLAAVVLTVIGLAVALFVRSRRDRKRQQAFDAHISAMLREELDGH